MPVAQLLIFGFAINTDVKHLATAIFDQSRTQESREMISSFTSSNCDVGLYAHNIKEVNSAVESGKVKVALIFPPNYAQQRLRSGRQAQIQVIVDATDSMSASSALAAAQTLGLLKSQEVVSEKLRRMGVEVPPQAVDMRIRPWYNPDFITSWYIVPGIMGLLLTLTLINHDGYGDCARKRTGHARTASGYADAQLGAAAKQNSALHHCRLHSSSGGYCHRDWRI